MTDKWTTDENGNHVDWTKPPYLIPGSARPHFCMAHEDWKELSTAVRLQRINEYYQLMRQSHRLSTELPQDVTCK